MIFVLIFNLNKVLCWNQYQSGLIQIPYRSTLYFLRGVCKPSFPRSVTLGKFGDRVLKLNIQKLFKSSWLNSILVLGYINRCDFLSMGAWQKNKFHQLIFVNCFEIHWWKETWTENKKCQLLKFVCWIFHLWIYIYRISSHLLNYHLPIIFLYLSPPFSLYRWYFSHFSVHPMFC